MGLWIAAGAVAVGAAMSASGAASNAKAVASAQNEIKNKRISLARNGLPNLMKFLKIKRTSFIILVIFLIALKALVPLAIPTH